MRRTHPSSQDLIALGLSLGAMACAKRDRWTLSGVLVVVAILSMQFAVPLLVLAPSRCRVRDAAGAAATHVLVVVPLLFLNPPTAFRAITLGSGYGNVNGGLGLSGTPLVLVSRIAPIALSAWLSYWVLRRLGSRSAFEPTTMISLIAVSLGLRLVFEENVFAYSFAALGVALVRLDVQEGHLRASLLGWLTAVALCAIETTYAVFTRETWGVGAVHAIPVV